MKKEKLWIVDFQHTAGEVIKAMATCASGKDIREAIEKAELRINEYMGNNDALKEKVLITNVGLAADQSLELVNQIWTDPLGDPDPELF